MNLVFKYYHTYIFLRLSYHFLLRNGLYTKANSLADKYCAHPALVNIMISQVKCSKIWNLTIWVTSNKTFTGPQIHQKKL